MKSTGKQATATEATEEQPRQQGIRMQMEMVVKEDVILPFQENGQSVGQILDAHLMDLAKHGGEPRSFTFTFDAESWEQAKPMYSNMAEQSSDRFHSY